MTENQHPALRVTDAERRFLDLEPTSACFSIVLINRCKIPFGGSYAKAWLRGWPLIAKLLESPGFIDRIQKRRWPALKLNDSALQT